MRRLLFAVLFCMIVCAGGILVSQTPLPFNAVETRPGALGDACDDSEYPGILYVVDTKELMRCPEGTLVWTKVVMKASLLMQDSEGDQVFQVVEDSAFPSPMASNGWTAATNTYYIYTMGKHAQSFDLHSTTPVGGAVSILLADTAGAGQVTFELGSTRFGDDAGVHAGKMEIGGTADQPQFVVEGHSTQTNSIVIVQNDADTELFSVSPTGSAFIKEKAAADADVAADGQWWTRTATPNEPMFTDDAGNDFQLNKSPVVFSNFIDQNTRNLDVNLWGSLLSLSTGDALDPGPTNIVVTNGISKLLLVLNTCSDAVGDITATGTSVNRDTGATGGGATSVMTVATVSTDTSDTDAENNVRHAFSAVAITDKWFVGSVTFTTPDVTCTDVDTYSVAFEQVNDAPSLTLTTLDINAKATHTNAWLYAYCYVLDVTGDLAVLTREASVEVSAATSEANKYYRLRRGALAKSIDGTSDGFWCEVHLGPDGQALWQDVSTKVWFDQEVN